MYYFHVISKFLFLACYVHEIMRSGYIISQARRNEIDIGGAVNKANCTGLRENFCSATPFRLLESNLAIQIAIFNG